MNAQTCACTEQPCGCCEGVQKLTPASVGNRPGLPALRYRVGTHGQFLETMKARLSTMEVDGLAADGQTPALFRPLRGLTTRDASDPSIALLDGWATVGEVLSFYQERIANEGYLRTATERRSVLELSRLVGYRLRPGVAASVYLAYTLDDKQTEPVTIAAGARSQSIPGPDELPQSFETSEDLVARPEWNNLPVRLKQPPNIKLDTALTQDTLHVAGVSTNLKAGDKLLMTFSDDGATAVVRTVASIDTQFADQHTAVKLQPIDAVLLACTALLAAWVAQLTPLVTSQSPLSVVSVFESARDILSQTYLGLPPAPAGAWVSLMRQASDNVTLPAPFNDLLAQLDVQIKAKTSPSGPTASVPTDPSQFVNPLLRKPLVQARNSLTLSRSLSGAFLPKAGQALADAGTQLLVNFVPGLAPSYYAAWEGAKVNAAVPALKGVYVLRARSSLFGANAAKPAAYYAANDASGIPAGTLKPQNLWTDDWVYADDESEKNAFLDQGNDAIAAGSFALIEVPQGRGVLRIARASTAPRSAYGLSGPSTQLVFESGWRRVQDSSGEFSSRRKIDVELRRTQVYIQSEALSLLDEPITTEVSTQDIPLAGLYKELTSGRWVILSGERADIDNVSGVRVSELLMISAISHDFDPKLPGDKIHTTLTLATPPAYRYKRDTLTIRANVVKATHGETRSEVLGSGNGAQGLQSFALKQPPLTYVAAPTAEGTESTLHVYVNDVEWHEAESLAWLKPKDRGFTTLTDDAGATSVVFGNGQTGARLPTGVLNVSAVYRNGIGAPGNVKAEQISLLQTRPLGVKGVINPLRASGGADKESRDLARENAPLSVMPLDRLVSVQDHADFTRRFAGIAKAIAQRSSDGRRQVVYLTIAGVDDIPIDPTSDLYRNLLDALRKLGDTDLPVRVDLRELKALVLSAKIKLLPDYRWEPVVSAVRAQVLDQFGFNRRALGQPALLCEVISAIQNVRGVAWVDVDAFGAVPEKVVDKTNGLRRLPTQDEIARLIQRIVQPPSEGGVNNLNNSKKSSQRLRLPPNVDAWPGGSDAGVLRPAELVIFTPAVADTLILNQIP